MRWKVQHQSWVSWILIRMYSSNPKEYWENYCNNDVLSFFYFSNEEQITSENSRIQYVMYVLCNNDARKTKIKSASRCHHSPVQIQWIFSLPKIFVRSLFIWMNFLIAEKCMFKYYFKNKFTFFVHDTNLPTKIMKLLGHRRFINYGLNQPCKQAFYT